LCNSLRNRIRPRIRLKTEECKHQQLHSASWTFVHRLSRYASTIVEHCIALLQLL
jgi:hypothetical protein